MKEIIAENYALESFQEEEEANRLSFSCNPIITEENKSGSTNHSPTPPSARTDPFEFFVSQPEPETHSYHNDIVFCRKVFTQHEEEEDQLLNEYEKRDYFATIRSHFHRRSSFQNHDAAENRRLTASTRLAGDILTRPKCSTGDLVQRVNISSLTSMSAKLRRMMFMFGPVKFRPEMEMSAIKQRQQARRPPAEKAAASTGGGKRQWGVVRSSLRGDQILRACWLSRCVASFVVA